MAENQNGFREGDPRGDEQDWISRRLRARLTARYRRSGKTLSGRADIFAGAHQFCEHGWNGFRAVETYLDDWREVDGIKYPFTISQRFSKLTLIFTVKEIKHNVPIEEHMFEP